MIGCPSPGLTPSGQAAGKPFEAWLDPQAPEVDEVLDSPRLRKMTKVGVFVPSGFEPMSVIPVADDVSGGWRQRRAQFDDTELDPSSPTISEAKSMLTRSGSNTSIMDVCDTVKTPATRYFLMGSFLFVCLLAWGFNIICMYASPMKHHLGATLFGQGLGRLTFTLMFSMMQIKGHALFEPMGDISCGEVLRECWAPFVCGMLLAAACLCLSLGVSAGIPASVLGPGASMYVVFAVVLGICHKRERLTVKRLIGLSGALASAMLLATKAKELDDFFDIGFEAQHLLYLGGVCVAWGASYHGMTTASSCRSLKLVCITHDMGSFFVGTMALLVSPTHNQLVKQEGIGVFLWQFGFVFLFSSLGTMGNVSYVLLSRIGKETSMVVPATSMWSIVVSIYGWTVRGEAINAPQLLGVVMSPVCIAMLLTSEGKEAVKP